MYFVFFCITGLKVHDNQHSSSGTTTGNSQVKHLSPEQRKKTTQELRPVDVNVFFGATPDKDTKANQVIKKVGEMLDVQINVCFKSHFTGLNDHN